MKYLKMALAAALLLGLGLTGLKAQTLYVKESNDAQTEFNLSKLRKITFTGGEARILKNDKSTSAYTLSNLRYLNFKDLSTSITESALWPDNKYLHAYPNPVSDILYIDLTGMEDGSGYLSIYALDGKLLQNHKTDGKGILRLDLSQLSQGIYLCQYSSLNDIRTIKIIKN